MTSLLLQGGWGGEEISGGLGEGVRCEGGVEGGVWKKNTHQVVRLCVTWVSYHWPECLEL